MENNMNKPTLIYCYDAYCGWCYGFSPIINKIAEQYKNEFFIEVLSGGMMVGDDVMPIEKIGPLLQKSYQKTEELTGVKFGTDYLWHINNPDKSDWVMNSEKPAIALCVFKEYFPDDALLFATDIQHALFEEGRDLDDDEAYRHLLEKYKIPENEFYSKLKAAIYKEKAYEEFDWCRHLQVNEFPQVLVQQNETKYRLLAKGFTNYETINGRILEVLEELKNIAD